MKNCITRNVNYARKIVAHPEKYKVSLVMIANRILKQHGIKNHG